MQTLKMQPIDSAEKGVSKIKGRGGDVKEAIEALGDRVKEFKEEAETCSQIMLGRTHDRVQNIQSNLGQVGEELSSKLGEVQQEMQKILTNQQEMPVVIATLFNTLYAMFASDERFNPLDGTCKSISSAATPAHRPHTRGQGY